MRKTRWIIRKHLEQHQPEPSRWIPSRERGRLMNLWDKYVPFHRALASIFIGWLLFCTPAVAQSSYVSLLASGAAGDACSGIYNTEETISSGGTLTSSSSLQESYSAVGLDNGYPNAPPPNDTATGCQYSPVFAHIGASGLAQFGLLEASANADMETTGLLQANSGITVGWFDTFTAVTGGTYELLVGLNGSVSANPTCPGGNPLASLTYSVTERGPFQQVDEANWNLTDCYPSAAPTGVGDYQIVDEGDIDLFVTLSVGQVFTVSGSMQTRAGAGLNESSIADASDTATVSVVGENGATYSTASGTDYDTPEPASWVLVSSGLAALGLTLRSGFKSRT